jgi:transcription antitermination factor NusG
VYTSQVYFESATQLIPLGIAAYEPNWYAVHTKARHEKRVTARLEEKQVYTFLPLFRQIQRWSDRKVLVDFPMFSCYAFVRTVQTVEQRLKILRTPGVLSFVGCERQGTPIPQEQIESLRKAISGNIPCFAHPFIKSGRRVRIRGGSLDGVEGILERQGADQSLIVSIELLHRSIAIRVEGYDIELV